MPLTVADVLQFLNTCRPEDLVVVQATIADGAAIGVRDLTLATDQGGSDGEGVEVVIGWEPGAEVLTRP
jgi:hypothetical protein